MMLFYRVLFDRSVKGHCRDCGVFVEITAKAMRRLGPEQTLELVEKHKARHDPCEAPVGESND